MDNNTSTYAKVLNFLVNAGYGNEAWIYEVSADIARIFNPEPCDHDDLPSFDVFDLYNSHRELMPILIGLMPGIAEAIGIDDDEALSEFRFMVALKSEQELPKPESEPTKEEMETPNTVFRSTVSAIQTFQRQGRILRPTTQQCDFCGEFKSGSFVDIYDENYDQVVSIQCSDCNKAEMENMHFPSAEFLGHYDFMDQTTQQKIFDFLNQTSLAKNMEWLGQWALELANIFDCVDAETRFNLCGDFYLKHDWFMEELFEAIEAFEKIHTPQSGIVFETFLSIHIVND